MSPVQNARLTCISNFSVVTYSGMLPGVLSGQYPPERMQIDLVRATAGAGARLIVAEVTGIDLIERQLQFADRPSVGFDALSIGTGSIPDARNVLLDEGAFLAIKPMQTFLERLTSRLEALRPMIATRPLRLTIVGAGAGGMEISFCLPLFARRILGDVPVTVTVIDGHDRVIRGVSTKTADRVKSEAEVRGTKLLLNRRVEAIRAGQVRLADGQCIDSDLTIWATRATAPPLLSRLGLPVDRDGFLLTNQFLQSMGDEHVFAVGDSGSIVNREIPKAGVYAVRQGPILLENIRRLLGKQPLLPFEPQHDFLKLFNTGDGGAIGEYKGFTIRGKWCWKIKDWIDGRFMDKYQSYSMAPMPAMAPMSKAGSDGPMHMRCAGCGGKVGGSVLSRVFSRLEVPASEEVVLGLADSDDVAIIRPQSRPLAVTVDFFAAPLDDPFLVGRLAALNAASDVFASGARPIAALAMATIPVGRPRQQEQLLYELLDGALREFRLMNATLVGGHTIEGPQLTLGFTMLAPQLGDSPRTKAGLRVGDALILTKPLGTGILLAANMQARCSARSMDVLIPLMLQRNELVADVLSDFDVSGLTDVTGFGLAGHLMEMLKASQVGAALELDSIQLIPGVRELIDSGLESTIAPANRSVESDILVDEKTRRMAEYAALFDPQTCGGLLIGVAPDQTAEFLQRLSRLEGCQAHSIGRVIDIQSPCLVVRPSK